MSKTEAILKLRDIFGYKWPKFAGEYCIYDGHEITKKDFAMGFKSK